MPIQPGIYPFPIPGPGRLAIMAKPRAGEWLTDEIAGLRRLGIDVLVSLLEQEEAGEVGLGDEPDRCRRHGIAFFSFPIVDRGIPANSQKTLELVDRLIGDFRAGRSVVLHCRSGNGRAGMMAAAILVRGGWQADAAFALISEARRVTVPDTDEQRDRVKALPSPPHPTRLAP